MRNIRVRFLLAGSIGSALLVGLLATSANADPIDVEDQYGRTVTLQQPAERIVTIPMPAASMLVAIDGGDERLAGMHPMSKTVLIEGILGDFFPSTKAIPSDAVGQGFSPNIEALLSLEPDLVFQWGHQGESIVAPLRDLDIPLVLLKYGTEEDTRAWLQLMGQLTGNEERAQRLISWRESVLTEVSTVTANVAPEDRPRVLYFLRYNSELRVAGSNTYNDFYIDLAGGINPAAESSGWLTVDPEQVLVWNPEVILLNGFEDDLSPADVYNNPLYADLPAVKNRRVYQLPLGGYRWDPPNQESPLTWKWLAMNLHPDIAQWPLRQDIVDAYAWIYGQTPTDEQLDGILRIASHQNAAGYQKFAADAR